MSNDWTEDDATSAAFHHAGHAFPGASTSQDLVASRILGGVSNVNFRVRLRDSQDLGVVVRFRQKGEAASFPTAFAKYIGGGRSVELTALQAASDAKVGPELLHYDETEKLMITR